MKGRARSGTIRIAAEQKVFASDQEGSDCVLGLVIADLQMPIVQESLQQGPLTHGVVHGFAEQALGRHSHSGFLEPFMHVRQQRCAVIGTGRLALLGLRRTHLTRNAIERLNGTEHLMRVTGLTPLGGIDELAPHVGPTTRMPNDARILCQDSVGTVAIGLQGEADQNRRPLRVQNGFGTKQHLLCQTDGPTQGIFEPANRSAWWTVTEHPHEGLLLILSVGFAQRLQAGFIDLDDWALNQALLHQLQQRVKLLVDLDQQGRYGLASQLDALAGADLLLAIGRQRIDEFVRDDLC